MKTIIFPIAFIAALSFSSCGGGTKDTKEVAEESNDSTFDNSKDMKNDAEAMAKAASMNMWEVQYSEAALPGLVTPEARELAQMMIDSHKKVGDKAMALAAEKQITLPAGLTEDEMNKINRMQDNDKGINFDKSYADQMIDDHKKAVDHFEKSADRCEDPSIKAFFADNLADLRNHQQRAESTKETIKDRKK